MKIQAFNRTASIGGLYDARTCELINGINIFSKPLPDECIVRTDINATDFHYIDEDDIGEKYSKLDVSASIKIDIMSMFHLEGSASFLKETKKSFRSIKTSLVHKLRTKTEAISVSDSRLQDLFFLDFFENSENATHVIIGIEWGANTIGTFEYANSEDSDKLELKGSLKVHLNKAVTGGLVDLSGQANVDFDDKQLNLTKKFSIKFVSDIIANDRKIPQTYEEIKDFFSCVPLYLKDCNNGKGIQMQFMLFPINDLQKLLNFKLKVNRVLKEIEVSTINILERELNSLTKAKQKFHDYIADIASFQNLFSEDIIEEAELKEKEVENAETKFRKDIKQAMDSVRSGNKGSEKIDEILSEFLSTENSSLGIKSFLRKKEISLNKIKQFRALKNYGVETLTEGLDKFSLNKIYVNKSVFILFFSDEEKKSNKKYWDEIYKFYINYVRNFIYKAESCFFICNTEINNNWDCSMCIQKYKNGKLVEPDVYLKYKDIYSEPLARCKNLIKGLKSTIRTKTLEIHCPNYRPSECADTIHKWKCEQCAEYFKYGFDEKLYCKCGRGSYKDFVFKCSNPSHPDEFIPFEKSYKLDEEVKDKDIEIDQLKQALDEIIFFNENEDDLLEDAKVKFEKYSGKDKLCDLNEFKEIIQHTFLQWNCFREHEDMVSLAIDLIDNQSLNFQKFSIIYHRVFFQNQLDEVIDTSKSYNIQNIENQRFLHGGEYYMSSEDTATGINSDITWKLTPALVKGSYLIQSVQHNGYLSGKAVYNRFLNINDDGTSWKLIKMKDHHYLIQCLYDKSYLQGSGGHHTKNFSEVLENNSATSITWKLIAK